MSFFKQIEGEAAVIVSSGIYRQVDLYERDGYLYARTSGGYIRLMADGATSKDKTRLEFLSYSGALFRDTFNRLCTPMVKNSKPIAQENLRLLGQAA